MSPEETSTVSVTGKKQKVSEKQYALEVKGQQGASIISLLSRIILAMSPVIIIFGAATYSATWHFQRFWGTSADFWQTMWNEILDVVGEDPVTLWVYGSVVVFMAVYWIFGVLYTVLDVINKPKAIMRYKTQPGMNEPVDTKRLLKVIGVVLINQTIMAVPMSYVVLPAMTWRGYPPFRKLPTFHRTLFDLVIFIIIEEIAFYYSHRFLHQKFLYKFIHKKHHEWTAPIAVAAVYAHPIDHVLSNVMPVFLGVFVMGSHVAVAYLWFTIAVLVGLHTHSGYHLPFLQSPEFHDFHHLKFDQNYGVLGVMDRVHGTDIKFRRTASYQRHTITFNLTPPRATYPDVH